MQLSLLGTALSTITAATATQAEKPKRGGTAIVQMISEQGILNPALRASTGVYRITGKLMEPLIDKTYEGYVGVLATD